MNDFCRSSFFDLSIYLSRKLWARIKNLEKENKCFQIVKWHILKYSLDGQMRALYLHKLRQEKEGKLEKGRKADRAPCLAVERLESVAQFNERFGQDQTTRQGIGWNQNK